MNNQFPEISVGDTLPPLVTEPITRTQLAYYMAGSGDYFPVHVDIDFARNEAGLPDVIGHGMLTMAFVGRLLTDWCFQGAVKRLSARFLQVTRVGDVIVCTGGVKSISLGEDDETVATIVLAAKNQNDEIVLKGEAQVLVR